jgi:hypothetical protein
VRFQFIPTEPVKQKDRGKRPLPCRLVVHPPQGFSVYHKLHRLLHSLLSFPRYGRCRLSLLQALRADVLHRILFAAVLFAASLFRSQMPSFRLPPVNRQQTAAVRVREIANPWA